MDEGHGQWMYADAGLWPGWLGRALAKEDPLRWSRKMDLEELQEHLTWHAEDWRRIRLWLTALHGTAVESAEYADKTEAVDALRQKRRAAHTECVECVCGATELGMLLMRPGSHPHKLVWRSADLHSEWRATATLPHHLHPQKAFA